MSSQSSVHIRVAEKEESRNERKSYVQLVQDMKMPNSSSIKVVTASVVLRHLIERNEFERAGRILGTSQHENRDGSRLLRNNQARAKSSLAWRECLLSPRSVSAWFIVSSAIILSSVRSSLFVIEIRSKSHPRLVLGKNQFCVVLRYVPSQIGPFLVLQISAK